MEVEFAQSTVSCLSQILRTVQNQEQTQDIRLSDGMPDVGSVIASWGQVILRGKEWQRDCVSVSGGIMVWILYAPDDGGDPRRVESWIPFQMKWDLPDQSREGILRISSRLRFVDARSVSPRKILVRAGVGVQAEALVEEKKTVYMAQEACDEAQLLRNVYPIRLPKEAGEKRFALDEELTLPGSHPEPDQILAFSVTPQVTEQRVLTDKLVMKGNGNLHLLYRDREGQLWVWDTELPFSQFADLENDYGPEAGAQAEICVTALEAEPAPEGRLRLKCGMVGQYVVHDRHMLEIVEDAYCPNRETQLRMETVDLPAVLETRQETVPVEQIIAQDASRVLETTFLPDFPVTRRTAEGIELELPGQFQVLYCGEDGAVRSSSAHWEGSWRMKADDGARVQTALRGIAWPEAVTDGSEIRLRSGLTMDMTTTEDGETSMVAGFSCGPQIQPEADRPSLILRRMGEDRLWDVAKKTGSTMEDIRQANSLEDIPDHTRILLIPVK